MEDILQYAILAVCLILSAFFSGMETGIISTNRLRILHRSRNGSKNAKIIGNYLRKPDKLLGTTLVGNNLVNVTISTISAEIALHHWGATGVACVGAVTTVTLLVFGEFLPKAWFSSRPLERCLPLAGIMRTIEVILAPFSWLIMIVTDYMTSGKSGKDNEAKIVTLEHLQWLARDSEAGGKISPLERLVISRILTLQLKTASNIMTPWKRVNKLSVDDTLADAAELVRKNRHLKIPVLSADGKTCAGVLYMQDVLAHTTETPNATVRSFIRKPFYVRSEMRADDVLPVMRRNSQHLAIVRDQSGRLLGVITIAGLLRIFVGNLPPETTGDRKAEKSAAVVTSRKNRIRKQEHSSGAVITHRKGKHH